MKKVSPVLAFLAAAALPPVPGLFAQQGAPAPVVVRSVFDNPAAFPRHRMLQFEFLRAFRSGKPDEMEAACRQGVALMPLDPTWRYNLACALAYRADKTEALASLDRAVELGFRNADQIAGDRDLASLKDLPAFKDIVAKAVKLGGSPVEGVPAVRPTLAVMGRSAEVTASNTVFDLDQGVFKSFFTLLPPAGHASVLEAAKASGGAYGGPERASVAAWLKEGSAAGMFGDLYVNRDAGHSLLAFTNYPGLTPVEYGAEARSRHANFGAANSLFDYPVIGNASVALASGPYWRSVPRMLMGEPAGFRPYLENQLWFYPAHRDFTVAAGDILPANTPYWVISLGSSGTDQPFLQAFCAALSALRPATKRALVLRQDLAPAMQMLFRLSQKSVRKPEDYLSGAAHPAVFDARDLDVAGFVRRAHELLPGQVPPLAILKSVAEAVPPAPGVDYFDLKGEALMETPCAIARIVRSVRRRTYRLTVKAQVLRGDAPAFVWKVLQGDPAKVSVKPLDASGSTVEIAAEDPGVFREAGSDGSPSVYTSTRLDIGCFVKQGGAYSAPSFVSLFWLPDEMRLYRDDGQVQSVNYENPNHHYADPELSLAKNWKDLYEYDDAGHLCGWYRTYAGGGRSDRFTADGHRVLETDRLNRPVRACSVQYLPKQPAANQPPTLLSCMDSSGLFTYSYASDKDKVGQCTRVK